MLSKPRAFVWERVVLLDGKVGFGVEVDLLVVVLSFGMTWGAASEAIFVAAVVEVVVLVVVVVAVVSVVEGTP